MAYWIYSELQIMPKIPLIMRDLHTKKQKNFCHPRLGNIPFTQISRLIKTFSLFHFISERGPVFLGD